jgi:hypothetical protein
MMSNHVCVRVSFLWAILPHYSLGFVTWVLIRPDVRILRALTTLMSLLPAHEALRNRENIAVITPTLLLLLHLLVFLLITA